MAHYWPQFPRVARSEPYAPRRKPGYAFLPLAGLASSRLAFLLSGGFLSGCLFSGTQSSSSSAGGNVAVPDSATAGRGGSDNNGGDASPGTANDAAGGDGKSTDASDGAGPRIATSCGLPVTNASPGNACYGTPPPALKLTPIVEPGTELFAPLLAISPPGDDERLFVVERAGYVRIIKNGQLLPQPFADIEELVVPTGGTSEMGLLGMAFDPDFANNKKVWLHYNNPDYDSVLASIVVSESNPDLAAPESYSELFTVNQPAGRGNHKGGMIAFGRDGCLYVGYGDGGAQNDPDGFGQDNDEPMGSILRLDHNANTAAPGNPGYGDARIWSYGLRNPYRFAFDFPSGDLYIGDVGQGAFEEVNVEPSGTGNFNYGWDLAEGLVGNQPGMRTPLKAYAHGTAADQGNSVTGGFVYRGAAIPQMVGRYLYADFESDNIWVLTYAGEREGQAELCDEYSLTSDLELPADAADQGDGPSGFGQDANGELYLLTLKGGVFKIEAE